jgi:hypothetical protein
MLHFQLFGERQYINKKTSHQQKLNHLTSINVNLEPHNDGNILIAQELSDALQAKISWDLLTP